MSISIGKCWWTLPVTWPQWNLYLIRLEYVDSCWPSTELSGTRTCFDFVLSVGIFKNGRVEIIANDQGNRITPSYVAFTPEGERLIGDAAKNQLTSNPENTIFDAKRLIGRNWNDPSVQKDVKFFPFKVRHRPQLSATLLRKPQLSGWTNLPLKWHGTLWLTWANQNCIKPDLRHSEF